MPTLPPGRAPRQVRLDEGDRRVIVQQCRFSKEKSCLDEVDRITPLGKIVHGEFGRLPSLRDEANAQQGFAAFDRKQPGMQAGLSVPLGGLIEGGQRGW